MSAQGQKATLRGNRSLNVGLDGKSMRDQSLALVLKGWLVSCLAAAASLFVVGLANQIYHPDGLTAASLTAGFVLSLLHLAFIALISAIPAALVIWITEGLRIRFVGVFVMAGAAIGWLGQGLMTPWPDRILWPFVCAGLISGATYWYVAVRGRAETDVL
ncbi:hypothetical protein ACE103_27115 [Bradyrhizobium sp. ma5]|uniref:hypothetical protein n=1 Tax=unclassified Bradyrhizobium TaxID=2631580 RepID=UPI001CC54E53|nr:hypothetical protein [Bradyrhizobium sp. RD5-C2]